MTNTFRDCPGCRHRSEFVSIHPGPEGCPDVSSGICPEWFCTACGAGLLLEVPPGPRDLAADLAAARARSSLESLDRVA